MVVRLVLLAAPLLVSGFGVGGGNYAAAPAARRRFISPAMQDTVIKREERRRIMSADKYKRGGARSTRRSTRT